jgi:carbamoyltransferase
MINLGISRVHNSAVTLLDDGEIVFHLENERLSNIKYDAFPFHTLFKIPEYTDKIDNICIAGVGETPACEKFTDLDMYTTFVRNLNKDFKSSELTTYDLWEHHHLLHAAHGFYNSGFTEALCIVKDGMGSDFLIEHPLFEEGTYGRENGTTFIASYPANFKLIDKHVIVPFDCDVKIDNVHITNNPSEALAFQKTSKKFGFNELDAGKVMGMSSYGSVEKYAIINDIGLVSKEAFPMSELDVRTVYVNEEFETFQDQVNWSYSLQKQTQESVKRYILKMIEQTGIKNVVLSGGFFLNCVANYEYLKDLPDDVNLYIEPVSSDAGTSIGAAKIVHHDLTGDTTIRKQEHIYLGLNHNYTKEDILSRVTENVSEVTPHEVAKLISEKNIVALYQGRSEAGPRALGNRSILYDPRDPNGKDHVNTIKRREWFRPFAGTILHEEMDSWFDMRGLDESPFMMYAVDVLKEKQQVIPAITHVDGTCRIQTLKKEQNQNYYDLINEFYKLTGVPILFNTSFNLAGDCIVETIDDALRTIRASDINYLYLPEFNILISK